MTTKELAERLRATARELDKLIVADPSKYAPLFREAASALDGEREQHPDTAECGFDRDASHSADEYVCTCGESHTSSEREQSAPMAGEIPPSQVVTWLRTEAKMVALRDGMDDRCESRFEWIAADLLTGLLRENEELRSRFCTIRNLCDAPHWNSERKQSIRSIADAALLRDLDTALTDWVRQYAPQECKPESVQESAKRIWDAGGTLAYIADLRERIKAAQSSVEMDPILARHSGKSEHREWCSIGEWLYPGDEIVKRDADCRKEIRKAKEGE